MGTFTKCLGLCKWLFDYGTVLIVVLAVVFAVVMHEPQLNSVISKDKFPQKHGDKLSPEEYDFVEIDTTNGPVAYYKSKNIDPINKDTVLFYGGFPDTCLSFNQQMDYFRDRTYNVIAVCQRGYYGSESEWSNFETQNITADINAAINDVGIKKPFHYVGHDWGSAIGQDYVKLNPQKLFSLTLLAVPHFPYDTMPPIKVLINQLYSSWYMFFFQLPFFPEYWIENMNGLDYLLRTWDKDITPNPARKKHQIRVVKAHHKNALGYYRAIAEGMKNEIKDPMPVPVLTIHGERDRCMPPATIEWASANAPVLYGNQRSMVESAGHFVHQTHPDEVNALLWEFIQPFRTRPEWDMF